MGPVKLDVPRDRGASFDPQLVAKCQRRLHGVDEMVISLTAKGLTIGEVQAHLAEVYGTEVSGETVPKITDAILTEMADRVPPAAGAGLCRGVHRRVRGQGPRWVAHVQTRVTP